MDFTLWAGGVRQRFENICRDVDIIENTTKYFDVVGEHVRKALDDVAGNWLYPLDTDAEAPVSGFSLEQIVVTSVHEQSSTELQHDVVTTVHEQSSTELHNHSDEYSSCDHLTQGLPSTNDQPESCINGELGCESVLPDQTSSRETDVSESVDSSFTEEGSKGSNDVAPTFYIEECSEDEKCKDCIVDMENNDFVAESVHRSSKEVCKSINVMDPIADYFENINIKDYIDDQDNNDFALASHNTCKKKSYKKKLKDVFSLKIHSRSRHIRKYICHLGTNEGMETRTITVNSAVSTATSSQDSSSMHYFCDDDWELL